ncbi:tripartite tricarboxylate transporter permease [Tindallia californiensis]|uniref:Putative tricarboxylic transport membrane protein n=1 Tax=Tindallia californiensis TaxID=159292 RepID=A0A1H3J392_9FIRM|nr:tripartite tricarboxylate transporter permease [Tindallia californiensis]SDY34411.1 putative tricarboxylic transport membrane protein [Tindallia californiensis]
MAVDTVALSGAVADVFTIQTMLFIMMGIVVGISVGAIPGLAHSLPIALVLPFSFVLPLAQTMGLLIGTYVGGTYGGSITAIAFGTPGTSGAAATVADGYGLTQMGKGKKALQMGLYASVLGGFFGSFVLIFLVVPIGRMAPRFGPAELTALYMLALSLVVVFSAENPGKGIMSAGIGFFLAIIGRDIITGGLRFTFGIRQMQSGFPLVPLLMGFFALPVIVKEIHEFLKDPDKSGDLGDSILDEAKKKEEGLTIKELFKSGKAIGIGSVLGTFLGALPGPGATLASYTSYSVYSQISSDKNYGKGSLDGVAAAEAANNATCGATFIPMLTFGIPGSSIAALMMAALVMEGVPVGPRVVVDHTQVVYTLFILMLMTNPLNLVFGWILIPVFTKLSKIPVQVLWPIIAVFLVIGTYAYSNMPYHTIIAIVSGFIGYFYKWYKLPDGPLILAFLVTPLFEASFRQALTIARGNYLYFVSSPISIGLWTVTILSVFFFLRKKKQILEED